MTQSEALQQGPTTYASHWLASEVKCGQIHVRAFGSDQVSSSGSAMPPREGSTTNKRVQRHSTVSQRSRGFTKTIPNTPTDSLYHGTENLGKTIPEFRLTMKRMGLGGRHRPRHRRGSGRDCGQDRDQIPTSSPMEVEEDAEDNNGLLRRDWTEDNEESEWPCYWSLLNKLNRELRMTGE
ncbi:hypothetical protein VMCG_08900 [Cytospora schulzeri]|uniref:Uncharacterized protein n=1 Tax=Cytospora schulzeri TaxID=448051 RepID=A0A423VV14_9PEZI|nr:hypothetical protein VMCG_08900 [Valsa malicola]